MDLVCLRSGLVGGGEEEGAESESNSWSLGRGGRGGGAGVGGGGKEGAHLEEEGGVSEEEAMEE